MIAERLPLAIVACCILQLPGCFAAAQGYAPWTRPMQALLLQVQAETVPTNGLVAYWSMRTSGATVRDEWVTLDATARNGVLFGTAYGKRNAGASFDGADDYIDTQSNFTALNGVNTFTLAAWVYQASAGNHAVANSSSTLSPSPSDGFQLRLRSDDKVRVGVNKTVSGASLRETTEAALSAGWNHVAAVFRLGATFSCDIYVGGAAKATVAVVQTSNVSNLTCSRPLDIGRTIVSTGPTEYFAGYIDEVAIWNRALTSNEVHQIYSSPLYLDYKE
jgi:hypothetical protein